MQVKENNLYNFINSCTILDNDLRKSTLCFTGHRSQKLPWKFNENDTACLKVKEEVEKKIVQSIEEGYLYYMSGMALGFDMICAEIILKLRKQYPQIKLICALPCKHQDKFWQKENKKRYKNILKEADMIKYISDDYTSSCMLDRNNYMLNNSSKVIALYNGIPGGTLSTINKAKQLGLNISIINI